MRKLTIFGALVAFLLSSTTATALTVTSLVGDKDGLGGNVAGGMFLGPFDNRSPAELAATNGAQFTDYSTFTFGTNFSVVDFQHQYLPLASVASATLKIGVGGLQPAGAGITNDQLFIDGAEIFGAFDGINQFANGFGELAFVLPPSVFPALVDGNVTATITLNSVGGSSGVEPVSFDYSELSIETTSVSAVPLPPAIWLLLSAMGMLGLFGLGRRNPTP